MSFVRDWERPLSELESTRAWLAQQQRCTGTTGVIGFCMGGGMALMLAPRRGFSAASVPGVRKVPDRLVPVLTAAGIDHDIKVYPDAGHGFLNDHDPAELPFWVKVLAKVTAASYHEPSARDARHRIVGFLRTHLDEAGT
jgi:carboxymethylenebutenolidase